MMHISLEAIMSDYKEWQRKKAAMNGAIERYTEERMADEYGRIHTDGSRSGGQPVLEPCPVPWCGSSDVKARSFDANHRRHWIECGKCNFKTPQMPSRTKVITLWNTRQPTQSDALLDAEGVKLYWYRQGKDDGVEHERAKIVAWLRDGFVRDWGQLWRNQLINAIEAGEHLK